MLIAVGGELILLGRRFVAIGRRLIEIRSRLVVVRDRLIELGKRLIIHLGPLTRPTAGVPTSASPLDSRLAGSCLRGASGMIAVPSDSIGHRPDARAPFWASAPPYRIREVPLRPSPAGAKA